VTKVYTGTNTESNT